MHVGTTVLDVSDPSTTVHTLCPMIEEEHVPAIWQHSHNAVTMCSVANMTKSNVAQVWDQLAITLNNEAGPLGQPQIGSVRIRNQAQNFSMSEHVRTVFGVRARVQHILLCPGPECMRLPTSLEPRVCTFSAAVRLCGLLTHVPSLTCICQHASYTVHALCSPLTSCTLSCGYTLFSSTPVL